MAALEYTERWVCMHEDFHVHRQTKMVHVQSLPCDGAPWVAGRRTKEDGIFAEDDVIELSGIGEETREKLNRVGSVKKVEHLAGLYDDDLKMLAEVNGLGYALPLKAHAQAKTATAGKYKGVIIDHRTSDNPYKSRYPDRWMEMMDASTAMRK